MSRGALKRAVVLLAVLVFAPTLQAASRVECSAVTSRTLKRAVRYCALLPPSYDRETSRRYPVLYYLHGLGDNEQSLVHGGGWSLVEDLRAKGRIGEFVIVTPDGDRSFYLNSRDGRERYHDFFLEEFIPAIERKYRARGTRAGRALAGTSMGGYGALRFAFSSPQKFSAVSAHSAALMENLPPGLAAAPGIAGTRVSLLGTVFGTPLDRAFYERNSPITLARRAAGLGRVKIYFDCGTEDEYGFDAGAKALHEVLDSRRMAHEFHLYPGGHGWSYVARHLDASLEFHSRAFGLTK